MRYPVKENSLGNEYQKTFLKSAGKYFQIILIELGKKESNIRKQDESVNPFLLPPTCHWTTLEQVIEFSSNLNIQSKFTPDTTINYVDIDAIDNKAYRIREVKTRTVSELSSRARRVLKKGYMVYSLVRPYLNNLALIEADKKNFIGSTGFAVFKGTKLRNEFLKFILLSEYVRQRFLEMLSGFNSPTVTQEQFVQTPVPLVPDGLQTAIIDFLSDLERNQVKIDHIYFNKEIEKKIVNLHAAQLIANNLLKEITTQEQRIQLLRQTILQEAVQGKLTKQDKNDEPASELLKRIKAEKQKLVKEGKLKKEKELSPIAEDEIPFELPKGWVWCRLGDLFNDLKYGTSQKCDYKKAKHAVLRIPNLSKGIVDLEDLKFANLPETEFKNLKLAIDDMLIIRSNGSENLVGRSAVFKGAEFDCAYAGYLMRLRFNKQLLFVDYIHQALESMYIRNLIEFPLRTTSGVKNINSTEVSNLLIPVAPFAEQQRIVTKVQQLQQQLNALETQVQQSRQYAQQLLQAVLKEAFEVNKENYATNEQLTMAAEE